MSVAESELKLNSKRASFICRRNNNKLNRSSVNRRISNHIVKMSGPTATMPVKQQQQQNNKEAEETDDKERIAMHHQNDQNRQPVDRLPLVTTLLRACRDGNEIQIKAALRDVIIKGATKEELNLTDKSGRVSHVCLSVSSFLMTWFYG